MMAEEEPEAVKSAAIGETPPAVKKRPGPKRPSDEEYLEKLEKKLTDREKNRYEVCMNRDSRGNKRWSIFDNKLGRCCVVRYTKDEIIKELQQLKNFRFSNGELTFVDVRGEDHD
jgi:hypothetical protein